MSVVIKGGLLIDGLSEKPMEDSLLIAKDGKIAFIGARGRQDTSEIEARAKEVIDATGMIVLPGLIDPHVHLCLSAGVDCLKDFWFDTENLHGGDEILLLRAAQNAQSCLAAGITTVADCGCRGCVSIILRDQIKRGLLVGPRILSSGPPITSTGGHLWYMGLEVEGEREIRKAVRSLVKLGVDFIKVSSSGGFTDPFDTNPMSQQFSAEELRVLVEDAHRLGRRVASHAYSASACRASIAAGADRVEHCNWAVERGKYRPDEDYVRSMVNGGLWAGFTLGNSKDLLPFIRGEMPLKEDDYFAVFRSMRKSGVRIAIHSDAGCSNVRFEEFAISIAGVAAVLRMRPMEALSTATLGNARSLGIESLVGSIEVGKAADLLILDGNPLEDLLNLGRVWKVLKNGRVVAENGGILQPIASRPWR